MLPRSQSDNFANGGRPKKKPAPPRPPQPSQLKLQNSQSFRTTTQVKGYARSLSISHTDSGRPNTNDLIDFSTPPASPPKATPAFISKLENRPSEFMYRVGASIFYVKSPLKNSTSDTPPSSQPFSPPRPSAQSLLSSPMKTTANDNQGVGSASFNANRNPTIIRPYGGSTSSNNSNSSGSTVHQSQSGANNNNANLQRTSPARYGNVPLTWDEPPKKTPPAIAPKPTIIRPAVSPAVAPTLPVTRNYYDLPPESEEASDDESDVADSFPSPPMPDEPPPPPPPDVELEHWVEGTADTENYYEEHYPEPYTATENDQPYAIALYDYTSDVEGDLQIQTGDLVYLIKRIDDSWMFGLCGGAEGMFPSSYVNIVVPLPEEELEVQRPQEPPVQVPEASSPETYQPTNFKQHFATALYQFKAETENDLSLEAGDVVLIWGRINEDWLYGALNRQRGQFPAAFVAPVPPDLPTIEP